MKFATACIAVLCALTAHAAVEVVDDTGATVRLAAPAQRIVSLAPHLTEVLYAAGAGGKVVGVVEYSNFPEAAKAVRRIGGYSKLDLEAVAALQPDLAVGWEGGNAPASIARLRALGIPVYLSQPGSIDGVARTLERIGALAGTAATAQTAATHYRERLGALRERYAARPPVRTFYQVWKQPLLTVGGGQVISDAIRLCGGTNVFGALKPLAPAVTVEAVLAADPEAIVASGMDEARPEWLDDWRQWQTLAAVRRDNLFFVPPDLIQRHTPRLVEGIERLCVQLETARTRR